MRSSLSPLLAALLASSALDAAAAVKPPPSTQESVFGFERSLGAETTVQEPRSNPSKLYLDGKPLPDGFVYGCATSAYQVEGAWNVSGKGLSIWDVFAHDKGHGHIANDDTGDVADDFYHRYKTDLPLFKKALNVNVYDFTIAWTRILPNGTGTEPNKAGVDFYRNVIETSKANGMDTYCTLYHWDLPQALQTAYKGWLSPNVIADFRNYAKVVFDALDDVCHNWVTLNEPRTFCTEGFGPTPVSAPGLVGPIDDVFTCMHHALLAHANAVDVFRKGGYKGKIGIKVDGSPAIPLNATSKSDQAAVARANDFEMGWDVAPVYTGDYPPVMRETMGDRLKNFTKAESKLLKGSADFLGFDGYTSQWVESIPGCAEDPSNAAWPECINSYHVNPYTNALIGHPTQSTWNFLVNSTTYDGLKYFHDRRAPFPTVLHHSRDEKKNVSSDSCRTSPSLGGVLRVGRWGAKPLILSENGMGVLNETQLPLAQIVDDVDRIDWYRSTLNNIKLALDDGLPVVGFVPWSCISNLEWSGGFAIDFGLVHNNFATQVRTPKLSAAYLKGVLTKGNPINPFNFV